MTIANLIVNVAANTVQLQTDVAKVNGQLDSVQSAAGRVAKALIGAFSIRQISNFVSETTTAFAEQEAAANSLTAALKAQGSFTPQLVGQYAALADQFQNTTAFADDLVMEMQGLLVQVGNVMPAQMEGALKAATDLAAGLGIDLRTATMLVGKAFAGETGTLTRYGIVIDATKLKTDAAGAVMEGINKKFGGQAQTQIQGYAGKMEQLNNRMNDAQESAGELIASGLLPILDLFRKLPQPMQTTIGVVQSLSPNLETLAFALMAIGGPGKAIAIAITAFKSLAVLLTMPAGLVVAAVVAAIAIWKNWDTIGPIVEGVYNAVKLWLVDKFADVVKWIGEKVDMVTGFFKDMYDKVVGQSYVPDMVDEIGDQMDRLDEEFVGPVQDATDEAKKAFASFGEDLPNLIIGAFQGGGDVVKTLGAALGKELAKSMTTGMEKGFKTSAVSAGLTLGISAYLEWSIAAVNARFDAEMAKMAAMEAVMRRMQALMGPAADAGIDLEQALAGASGASQISPILDEIEAALEAHARLLVDIQTGFDALGAAAQANFGIIPTAMRPAIEALMEMAGVTEAQRAALENLLSGGSIDFDGLTKMAEGYGISLDALGPKFQQEEITRKAQTIVSDFDNLMAAGADAGGVLSGMSDEVSDLVNQAKKYGSALPEAMRPIITNLFEAGKLTDENGKKITSLAGLNFQESPLQKSTDAIVAAIDRLGALLAGIPAKARTAAAGVPDNPFADWEVPDITFPEPPEYHQGGVVMHAGGPVGRMLQFIPRAHDGLAVDERLLVGQTGEVMFSRANVAAMGGVGATEAFRRGLGSGTNAPTVINFAEMRAELVALRKQQEKAEERQATRDRNMPALYAIAARDAVQQQARRR